MHVREFIDIVALQGNMNSSLILGTLDSCGVDFGGRSMPALDP